MRDWALRFWHAAYAAVLMVARPGVRMRLRRRARREPEYGERVAERFGRVPADVPRSPVWFHTVSAGETIAAAPLIAALVDAFPDVPFLVTTMTPTGSAQVAARLGTRVAHCYAPYDFADAVDAFYDRVEPRLLVLMETELWPNLLRAAARRDVPALLVNARLSARSARGYARIGPLTAEMLQSLRFVACQYADHAERFLGLGAAPDRIGVLGSIKFDVRLPADFDARVAALRARWGLSGRPVWIAGSTHPGEETTVLEAHARLCGDGGPAPLLVLVPRHPARADEVARLIEAAGFSYDRTSAHEPAAEGARDASHPAVLLGDAMGELQFLYGLSDVAFLGGSLVDVGGHNPIEAAVCRQPLLMGPHNFNFPDVVTAFSDAGCLQLVGDAAELAAAVRGYLADPQRRATDGDAALAVVEANRGATARLLDLLRAEIGAAG